MAPSTASLRAVGSLYRSENDGIGGAFSSASFADTDCAA